MMERPSPQSKKVSLEDLLRLKRAERPDPEFWAEFETQLHRKQLAAIVDKRPWWKRLSTASLARISIPVGATAVIAFTLVTVRQNSHLSGESVATTGPVSAQAPATVATGEPKGSPASTSADSTAIALVDRLPAPAHSATPVEATESITESPALVASVTNDASEPSLAQVLLGLGGATESDARPQYEVDASPILASLGVTDGGLSQGFSTQPAGSFSQVSVPRDDRRARLLASVDPQEQADLVAGNSRVARTRDRIASRLTEQSLYDSISRLGLSGDSVSIKF